MVTGGDRAAAGLGTKQEGGVAVSGEQEVRGAMASKADPVLAGMA